MKTQIIQRINSLLFYVDPINIILTIYLWNALRSLGNIGCPKSSFAKIALQSRKRRCAYEAALWSCEMRTEEQILELSLTPLCLWLVVNKIVFPWNVSVISVMWYPGARGGSLATHCAPHLTICRHSCTFHLPTILGTGFCNPSVFRVLSVRRHGRGAVRCVAGLV